MGVTNGDGERVGGVVGVELGARHQNPHHHVNLLLVAMPDADHRLLDRIGQLLFLLFGGSNWRRGGNWRQEAVSGICQ